MSISELKELLERYTDNCTSPEEDKLLLQYFEAPEYEAILKDFIIQQWDNPKFATFLIKEQSDELYRSINKEIRYPDPIRINAYVPGIWLMAAAVIFVILLAGGWFLFSDYSDYKSSLAVNDSSFLKRDVTDIAPPSVSNAVLFFENGTKINLNSIDSEVVEKASGTKLRKLEDGQIIYGPVNNPVTKKTGDFNTLYNPRGSQKACVVLSDGTKVWLNAESSLKYPVTFTDSVRRVELSGEAYFEVAHQEGHPFLVTNRETVVKVLGTHFNVNTYSDDGKLTITLLEGSVKVTNGFSSGILKPGQQAKVDSAIHIFNKTDTAKVMAWKNEIFNFTEAPIAEIMKQIERWYDVQVAYEGAIPAVSMSGVINRNINASKVLEILRIGSGLDFRIEGRKIIVSKK